MSTSNADVATIFSEIADLLELQGGNAFRVRCYRSAARSLADPGRNLADMVDAGEDIEKLPGLGRDLAAKVIEIVGTGTCRLVDELRAQVPSGIVSLLHLPGMGPRRVQALHRTLGITSLQQLRDAAAQERVRMVRGFSPDGERRILEAVTAQLERERRFTLAVADPVAQGLVERLQAVPGIEQVVVAGSLRRRCETVGDIDIVAAARAGTLVMESFTTSPGVQRVLAQGPLRSSVALAGGLQADLRVVAPGSFGAALLYLSGAKAHNVALRRRAQAAGLKLGEHGLSRGGRLVAADDEASIYEALGLPWIAPELREDRGEIDAASAGALPRLVQLEDLRGDLHAHTSAGDGRHSLLGMAETAQQRGLSYLAITEHSHRVALGRGFNPSQLARQIDRIDELNEMFEGFRILKSIEVEILRDGELDLPDTVMSRLDLVVASVHDHIDLPRAQQTARLLRAMDHRFFTILAHPTSRVLEEHIAMDVDLPRVLRHARERGCFLELNAQPSRLDLDDRACRMAKEEGVLVSIASDAHSTQEMDHLRYGVGQARRGWLEPADVLNTRPLAELLPLLAATMGRSAREAMAA